MAQPIRIKRSNTTATPPSLLEGELAYSALSHNLFIGTNGGADIEVIGGQADHNKLSGIEAGAQVNTVGTGSNTYTGKQIFSAVSAAAASVLLPNGSVDPTTPSSGDMWANTGTIKWYNGSAVKSIAFLDSNITGTAANVSGTVAVAHGGTGVTTSTGTGSVVLSASPTLTTPNIGAATGISFNGITGLSSTTPVVDGTASVGTGTTAARSDHRHPTDTTRAPVANPVFTGTVTLAADPTSALHAATKQYVDNIAAGLDFKQSVVAATTSNITLSGTQTIDTVAVVAGDRVLVKNQTTGSENGIYIAASGAWTRSSDANISAEVTTGMFVFVEKGAQAGTSWVLNSQGGITLGTTALTFIQFGGGQTYTAGSGLTMASNVFSLGNHSAALLTSGTVADSRLSGNVLFVTSTIDGGIF